MQWLSCAVRPGHFTIKRFCFYKICNYICGACPSPCFSSLIYIMGYVSVMGYVSHIFMYMDIRNHVNLIKNHGYKGKIGMIKKDLHGIVMLAAKAGDVILYRPYEKDENGSEEDNMWAISHCSIETPLSEDQIQENKRNGCGLKTIGVCVNVPISIIEEIVID